MQLLGARKLLRKQILDLDKCLSVELSVRGFRVWGSGFRIRGLGFRIRGLGFRV